MRQCRDIERASGQQKGWYDLKVNYQTYSVGERVWVRDSARKQGRCPKLKWKFKGLYRIIQKISDVLYQLEGEDCNFVMHYNRLKPCFAIGIRDEEHLRNRAELPPVQTQRRSLESGLQPSSSPRRQFPVDWGVRQRGD
ncbi:UNVERIFIED_CONTAM: hypothetical protein FKN15_065462 [Acipenser sinensis]